MRRFARALLIGLAVVWTAFILLGILGGPGR